MQLVIREGYVIAIYNDEVDVKTELETDDVVTYNGVQPLVDPLFPGMAMPDPRTDEEKKLAYWDKRRRALPNALRLLYMIYKDQVDGTNKFRNLMAFIRNRFPAPTGVED